MSWRSRVPKKFFEKKVLGIKGGADRKAKGYLNLVALAKYIVDKQGSQKVF